MYEICRAINFFFHGFPIMPTLSLLYSSTYETFFCVLCIKNSMLRVLAAHQYTIPSCYSSLSLFTACFMHFIFSCKKLLQKKNCPNFTAKLCGHTCKLTFYLYQVKTWKWQDFLRIMKNYHLLKNCLFRNFFWLSRTSQRLF